MVKTNIDWIQMSDAAIVSEIGNFIKQTRLNQQITQNQLAKRAGLNRWTLSQIENGQAINLMSLIQILRALNALDELRVFEVNEEISPIAYAKLKKKPKQRVRNKGSKQSEKDDLEW